MNEQARHEGVQDAARLPSLIDPVCGMQVDASSPYRFTYSDREYLFCSARCAERFKAAPQQYLSRASPTPGHGEHAPSHNAPLQSEARNRVASPGSQQPAETSHTDSLAGAATIYTCPMHPAIRRPAPGNCPICGMALEPEMPTAVEERNPELEDFKRRFWWTLPLSLVGVAL